MMKRKKIRKIEDIADEPEQQRPMKKIVADMQFLIEWLAREKMEDLKIGMNGKMMVKPDEAKQQAYLVAPSIIKACRRLTEEIKEYHRSKK